MTALLALAVFITVTAIGFYKHGMGFLKLFWVASAPTVALRIVLAVIEVISYFVRPLSHSVRLAGNMMAGHAVLKVFAGFAGALGVGAFIPILAITAMLRPRADGGGDPGLRLRDPDLRLPQRRAASRPLSGGTPSGPDNPRGDKTMEGNIADMGQFIGAGLACVGMGGAGIGVGLVAGNFLAGALRNPAAAGEQTATLFIGIAFAEALGIFSFLVALLLMFAV